MAKKRTNEELVDDLMEDAMAGFALSGPDGSLQNVLRQNPTLRRLRREVLKRMVLQEKSGEKHV